MDIKMNADQLRDFLARVFPQMGPEYHIVSVAPFEATMRLAISDAHLRPGGTVSGPAIFALADLAIYAAVMAMIGPEALAVTTGASIDFMRKPPSGKDLSAHARLNKLGRQLAVGQVLIRADGDDRPVAQAALTYSIPPAGRGFAATDRQL